MSKNFEIGQTALWFDGRNNQPVVITGIVAGGYLIRTQTGMTVGPVKSDVAILR